MSTAPHQESTHAQARIRDLLERDRISEARGVLEEALVNQPEDEALQRLRILLAPPQVRRSRARDADRTKDFQWLVENGAKHRGSWVAVHGGVLVAEATSLDELLQRVDALALTPRPLVHFIE